MNIEIINNPLQLHIYGFAGIAVNKDYAGTAFRLMDKMWKIVKANNLKNKGINIWVYDQNENVFAGVELNDIPKQDTRLEQKSISLLKYASYKHIGPYNLIEKAGQNMTAELKRKGMEPTLPYIEIYGHWNSDETKLETGLIMCIQ